MAPAKSPKLVANRVNSVANWANVTLVLVRMEPFFAVTSQPARIWDYRGILR